MLVAVAALQRPDLFNAAVSQVPLADMKRYHRLLAGASWIDEYGDPDRPEDWAYISRYSPYHLLDRNATYPPIFFTSSTRDDRVHPAHARKMVARMQEQGHEVLYWENTDGGHGGAVNSEQQARLGSARWSTASCGTACIDAPVAAHGAARVHPFSGAFRRLAASRPYWVGLMPTYDLN